MFANSIAHTAADLRRQDLLDAARRDRLVRSALRGAQATSRTRHARAGRRRLLRRLIPILHH